MVRLIQNTLKSILRSNTHLNRWHSGIDWSKQTHTHTHRVKETERHGKIIGAKQFKQRKTHLIPIVGHFISHYRSFEC